MSANARKMDMADDKAEGIVALCHFIMSSKESQADFIKVATSLGIVRSRKPIKEINSTINPLGFEYKHGKMTLRGGRAGPSIPAHLVTNTNADDKDDTALSENTPTRKRTNPSTPEAQLSPEMPKTPGAPRSPNTPPSKRHERMSRNPYFTEEEIRIARKGKARAEFEEEHEEEDSDADMD